MKNTLRSSRPLLARIAAALVLAASLAAFPAAAQAVFTATARASVTVSAMTLEAPDPALMRVTATCANLSGNKRRLDITVISFGPVPGAGSHTLAVSDPSGAVVYRADLSSGAGRSFGHDRSDKGDWSYEIRGEYRVPGTSNMWTGKPLTGTVTCK